MEELLDGTGWYVREFLNPEGPGTYIALIEKEPAAPAKARKPKKAKR